MLQKARKLLFDGHSINTRCSLVCLNPRSCWFGPLSLDYYDLCPLMCVQHCFGQRLPLSRHITQTSLGTTRFFLSIYLPHLSCNIACSYRTLACIAVLSSCITAYEISVCQIRDLSMNLYLSHMLLTSDSRSPSTPLLSEHPSTTDRIRTLTH